MLLGTTPNPSAGTMRFTFQIGNQRRSSVSLRICDVSGRSVATLADGVLKPGVYHRDWLTSPSIPNGVYFLSLATGDYRESRKLILTR
jgi:hypothetical protein